MPFALSSLIASVNADWPHILLAEAKFTRMKEKTGTAMDEALANLNNFGAEVNAAFQAKRAVRFQFR